MTRAPQPCFLVKLFLYLNMLDEEQSCNKRTQILKSLILNLIPNQGSSQNFNPNENIVYMSTITK